MDNAQFEKLKSFVVSGIITSSYEMKMKVNSFFFTLGHQDDSWCCVNSREAVDNALVSTAGEWQHLRENHRWC